MTFNLKPSTEFLNVWTVDNANNPKIQRHYGSLKMIGIESFTLNPAFKSTLLEKYVDQLYNITNETNFTFNRKIVEKVR